MIANIIPNNIFYFEQDFAPIIVPEIYNSPEKRFGYVLSVMRKAREIPQDKLETAINPDSSRGGSTISDWEIAKKTPKLSDLDEICSALDLSLRDREYLINLLIGNSSSDRMTQSELKEAEDLFQPYRESTNPAYLIDHHWNILHINTAVQKILRLPTHLAENLIGKNLLQMVFNPIFKTVDVMGGVNEWRELALGQIWGFRAATAHLRHQSWYIDLVYNLAESEGYQFLQLWYQEPIKNFDPGKSVRFKIQPAPELSKEYDLRYHVRLFSAYKKVEVVEWVEVNNR